jgi:pseudouridine-5'-phosphate glycosidase
LPSLTLASINLKMDKAPFIFSSEVSAALKANKPVVALESTVIAHGLPRPQNLETAHHLEEIVKATGAIPATIAILDGKIHIGLKYDELKFIAESDNIRKISIRDLPIAIAHRWNGATTVASTLWIAHRAGIEVFATGGIGGVHRGPFPDLSADLPQLARTPMVVVCSGAKIILDLPAIREWLETHGVTIVGYQCEQMPAFYSRHSGLEVDVRLDSPQEVARLVRAQRTLGTQTALLVTVPVPANAEVPSGILEGALENALRAAERHEIAGRELTPFLLSRMAETSKGLTVLANIALLENNARVGSSISLALLQQC